VPSATPDVVNVRVLVPGVLATVYVAFRAVWTVAPDTVILLPAGNSSPLTVPIVAVATLLATTIFFNVVVIPVS
jgi:hypothetical protein